MCLDYSLDIEAVYSTQPMSCISIDGHTMDMIDWRLVRTNLPLGFNARVLYTSRNVIRHSYQVFYFVRIYSFPQLVNIRIVNTQLINAACV